MPQVGLFLPPANLKLASREITQPFSFPWPKTWPVKVLGSYGKFSTTVNPRSLVDQRIWSTTKFIQVDSVNGNDATGAVVSSSTDLSKPTQSISAAIILGNATGVPYRIFIKSGTYPRLLSIGGNGGGIQATQPMSLEVWGGRAVHGIFQPELVWTVDTGATYTTSRSNILRVFDLTQTNKWGDYVELTLAASQAACESTPGTWYQGSGLSPVYVHRTDGAAVTGTNTRAYVGTLNNFQLPTSIAGDGLDVYCSGFDFEGGFNGCLYSGAQRERNIVFEDCTFKYSGSFASPIDCVQLVDMQGIAAFFRCGCSASTKDGFNFHYYRTDVPVGLYALTVDCWGHDCGRAASTSNNGHTGHETCVAIDVNGVYESNYGANFHWISDTRVWAIGTTSRNSLGDIGNGGNIPSTGFRNNNTSIMWLDTCYSVGNLVAITPNDGTATIYTRNCISSGGTFISPYGTTLSPY